MKRSITLATVLLAATAALAACGTGKYSQTATQVAPVPGFSQTISISNPPGTVGVSNAHLPYSGSQGFKAGAEVPLELWLFNNTQGPVTVIISTSNGTIKEGRVEVPVSGLVKPAVKVTGLTSGIKPGQSMEVKIDFVGYGVIERAILPVAAPEEPLPRNPIEAPEGEGH